MRIRLRHFQLAVIALAALTLACGGGDGDSDVSPNANGPGSTSSAQPRGDGPAIGKATLDLTVAMPGLEGRMTSAETTCSIFKATSATNRDRYQVIAVGEIGGVSHRIRMIFFGYTGAGDYAAEQGQAASGVQVEVDQASGRGAGTIGADLASGTIDGDILAPARGRLTGSWACASAPK